MWICLLGLILFMLITSLAEAGPRYSSRIVETESGAIRGVILELNSRYLEPVEAFLGVPYAAAPVGEKRFAWAGRPRPWKGTRLADTLPSVCPQRPPDLSNRTALLQLMPRGRLTLLSQLVPLLANYSEDCLHMNIYMPATGSRGAEAPYAILVFLHGESFEWNSGNSYDGSVLASHGHIIVVTVNYRLGILGYLQKEQEERSLAQSDVEAALRWIKHNMARFGGDPTRITVMGHGPGAVLANLLLLSASSKDLFNRAILLSGTVLSPWALAQQPDQLKRTIALQLGCPLTNQQLFACLKHLSLEALLSARINPPRFLSSYAPWMKSDPLAILKDTPENFYTTDLLLGTTTTESYLDFSAHDIEFGFEEDQRNRILRTYVRNAYIYHLNEIFSTVRNEYTDWEKPIVHPINIRDATLEALSDGHTASPLVKMAQLHARHGSRTYFFHFGYQTKETEFLQRLGSVRGDELPYIFGHPFVLGMPHFPMNYTRQDLAVSEMLMTYLCNYIKTGNPNERQAGEDKARHRQSLYWEAFTPSTQFYLNVAQKPRLKSHYRGHRMAIWLNLIPQLHQPGDGDVSMRHHHFHERESYYYSGVVRPESFTRAPPSQLPKSDDDDVLLLECTDNGTSPLLSGDRDGDKVDDEEGQDLLRKSQNAALGLTLAVGFLLLLLNVLVFAFLYCQHDKRRQKKAGRLKKSAAMETPPPPPPPPPPRPMTQNPIHPLGATVKKRFQIQEISV
ncbi:hypothetical protein LSTR_LSTR003977 [Laodelphax striatellus]|uniref:Carboxylesterase type B domain-containing protein n=1 Tax=Laodelphax striatellus TaxID=195883 RepID=A0A482WF36_LAOST|nr:hypothetical protein LSTR_LSTR003977 [Laodelphax striatellus]